MFVIVPNIVRDAINEALDTALEACPEAAKDRQWLYAQLLAYFNEHGEIPQFTVAKD